MVRALILAAALAGAPACVAGARAPANSGAAGPPCPATHGELLLERVNEIRVAHGLRPVIAEERVVRAAIAHSADQAGRGPDGVGHIGSDGSGPGDRLSATGYRWSLVAENVAAGMAAPRAVVAGWMESPPHRATILDPEAVHAGAGYVGRWDDALGHYWTLVVAAPREGAAARPLGCHP